MSTTESKNEMWFGAIIGLSARTVADHLAQFVDLRVIDLRARDGTIAGDVALVAELNRLLARDRLRADPTITRATRTGVTATTALADT